jgi:hypothetical protein
MPMDYNVVTLEIADLITHFDYYDSLISEALVKTSASAFDEQTKIRNKSKEHLAQFFDDTEFYNRKKQLRPLSEIKGVIIDKLESMKTKEIHDLVEKLEKDAKKIKKLYLLLTKK